MSQRALFDPASTVATACSVPGCAATRQPGQTTVSTCQTDRQRALGDWHRRPARCLNQPDPARDRIPF